MIVELLKTYFWIGLGILIALAAILHYLVSDKTVLRKQLREKMLRTLHEQGECEILQQDPIATTFSGEWIEAHKAANALITEGLINKENRRAIVKGVPQTFTIYTLTSKGVQEVERLFGPRPTDAH